MRGLTALVAGALLLSACTTRAPASPDARPSSPRPLPTESPPAPSPPGDPAPTVSPGADPVVRLLFFGNSHTHRHDVPHLVARLLRAGQPGLRVRTGLSPVSTHLDERAGDEGAQSLVRSQPWDVVVLQGQNYSLSGARLYPTRGAEELIALARSRGAVPVLYAEWARRGIEESDLIMATYRRIARSAPACIPPIPAAFDLARTRLPGGRHLALRAADGNHSTAAGAFLAALVLSAGISGHDPGSLPVVPGAGVTAAGQRLLREAAHRATRGFGPCA